MRFIIIKIIVVFLGVMFFYGFIGGKESKAETLETLQQEIIKIEQEVAKLEENSRLYQSTIQDKKQNITSLSATISLFDKKIRKLENDISLTSQQIILKNLLIQSLGIEIEKTVLDIDGKKVTLGGLLQVINDFDKKGLVEIFFEGNKLSDFFDQARYLEVIQRNLNQVLADVKNLKDELEVQKISSIAEKNALEELKQRTTVQKYALDEERINKKDLLSKTKGEESKYQSLLAQTLKEKSSLLKEVAVLEKEVERRKNFLFYTESGQIPPRGTRIFLWPEDDTILTQGYGMTDFAKSGAYGGAGHNGIDMSSGSGSPIKAAAEGEILVFGYNNGWGNWVAIKHQNGMVTLYAHMIKSTTRKAGDKIDSGSVIGYEGSTGFSTGSHLHFSVYSKFFTYLKNDQVYFNYFDGTLNPLNYM